MVLRLRHIQLHASALSWRGLWVVFIGQKLIILLSWLLTTRIDQYALRYLPLFDQARGSSALVTCKLILIGCIPWLKIWLIFNRSRVMRVLQNIGLWLRSCVTRQSHLWQHLPFWSLEFLLQSVNYCWIRALNWKLKLIQVLTIHLYCFFRFHKWFLRFLMVTFQSNFIILDCLELLISCKFSS